MITDDLTVNNNNKWKWFKCSITLTHTHMDVYMGIPLHCSIIRATMTGWCTHTHTHTHIHTKPAIFNITAKSVVSLFTHIAMKTTKSPNQISNMRERKHLLPEMWNLIKFPKTLPKRFQPMVRFTLCVCVCQLHLQMVNMHSQIDWILATITIFFYIQP